MYAVVHATSLFKARKAPRKGLGLSKQKNLLHRTSFVRLFTYFFMPFFIFQEKHKEQQQNQKKKKGGDDHLNAQNTYSETDDNNDNKKV